MVCGGKAWADTWDGTTTTQPSGTGTQADPYIITTGAELAWFGYDYKDKTYWVKVTDDIDLGGKTWPTAYCSGKAFKGHLIGQKADGSRPTISNYTLTVPNTGANYGLISQVSNGSIEGIIVSDVTINITTKITNGNVRPAALVGSLAGSSTMTNCSAQNVSITHAGTSKGDTYVGTLVAYADGTTITSNCTSSSCSITVTGETSAGYVGGLIGGANSAGIKVINCSTSGFTVNINANITGSAYYGGLLGQAASYAQVTGCSSTNFKANTNGDKTNSGGIGGLIGYAVGQSSISQCSSTNPIININKNIGQDGIFNLGGLIAAASTLSTISECTANAPTINVNADITGKGANLGGLIGYVSATATVSKCQTNSFVVDAKANVAAGSAGGLIANSSGQNTTIEDCSVNGVTYTNQSGNNFKGANWAGFIGYLNGFSTDWNTLIRRNTVKDISITFNGTLDANANIGGFIGYAKNYVTVDNAKATDIDISLGGNIQTGEIRIGGIIGYLDTKSTVTNCLLEGTNNKIHSSNTGLTIGYDQIVHVGGIIGVTASQSSTEANKTIIDNCAAYCDIDLSGYSLTSSTGNRNASFVIGGVIGRLYKPAYLPQTLYYSGKINAPYAMVGPLVGTFLINRSAAAYIYDDYSGMNTDIVKNGDYSHWYYGNYQLYLSDAVVNSGQTMNVTPSVAGYMTIGDVSTWTENKIGTTNKVSKTILPYSAAPSPAWNTNSNNYPAYYMYYAQGVNRGNYAANSADVTAAFNETSNELGSGVSWSFSDDLVSFGGYITTGEWDTSNHHNYQFTVKNDDGTDAPDGYYYVWKVEGVEKETGVTASLEALFDEQSATVDIYTSADKSNLVASLAVTIPHAEWIEIGADASPSGSGTEADPYLISTAAELGWVARYERDNTAAVRYYMLTADIDLSGAWWTPIGGIKRDKPFYGVFDGNQKTISNLTGEWVSLNELHSYGLFGAVGGQTNGKAEVKNLIIDHAQFKHVDANTTLRTEVEMGVLAGCVGRYATIKNIVIKNSSITGTTSFNVNGQQLYFGGAIGRLSQNSNTELDSHFNIYNLFVDVDFNLNSTNGTSGFFYYNVGGAIGQIRATYDAAYRLPQSIYYTGSIKAPQAAVGPIFANAATVKGNVAANTWITQYEGYPTELQWTDHKYGEYRIWPYGASDYITITDKSNLNANTVTSTWTVTAQTSKTESVAYNAVGKIQGVNTGEHVSNLEDVVTMFRAYQDPVTDVFDWAVDGDAIKMVEASLVVVLKDVTTTNNNERTLSLSTNFVDDDYTYEWIANGVSVYMGNETTHTFNKGGMPQLIYVKAYPKNSGVSSASLATSSVVDLPRKPLTATYTPMRTRELNGADFDGVFTVTPDASISNGYSMVYAWKEKSDDDQWIDLVAGTSATASADGKTCSTAGASQSKTYQCTITATDNDWNTFINNITDSSSPYYANKDEYISKYSSAFVCTLEVNLRNYKAVYLDPSIQYGGNDNNDGTKEQPVKTWKKAYSLLDPDGTMYDNYVVLMSEYVYNTTDRGLCNMNNEYNDSQATPSDYATWEANARATGMCVPATITSYLHDNDGNVVAGEIDYSATGNKPAKYKMTVSRAFLGLLADTRFEWMTFWGVGGDYNCIFAQYYNLEFGHGLKMTHFANGTNYGVLCSGSKSCSFQVFGGINNDARFKTDPRGFEQYLPHAKEGHKIIFRSGHYSNVCVTGRQTGNAVAGICGTPRVPIKCQIIIDIDREWNDTYKKCISENGDANAADKSSANYDIAMLLAGNHEGSQYGDVDLIMLSGNVARVVNGILGAQTKVSIPSSCGGGTYPLNSYMGRANILMDPSKTVDAYGNIVARTGSYSDEAVYVTELYGGGLGRRHSKDGLLNVPVYGENSVTINGGTIGIVPAELAAKPGGLSTVLPAVFGGASGGVNGIGDDASRNRDTNDLLNESLPYWYVSQEDGRVGYCNYDTWKTKPANQHVYVRCYDGVVDGADHYTDVDLQYAKTHVTINGGTFGTADNPLDGIYGGGSGYINSYIFTPSSQTSYPFTDAGTLYGKPGEVASSVTINGGTFYCNIYGAGRGSDFYYTQKMSVGTDYNAKYAALAKVYGNVEVNVNGGTIHGNIYGGGAGYAEAMLYNTSNYNPLDNMALLTGNTIINIGENANITTFEYKGRTLGGNVYGGGMLAKVNGNTKVNISGNAQISGSVFGAAQGIGGKTGTSAQTLEGTMNTYYLYNAGNNKKFGIVENNTSVSITGNATIEGNVYGGGNNGEVQGTTTVQIGEECSTTPAGGAGSDPAGD